LSQNGYGIIKKKSIFYVKKNSHRLKISVNGRRSTASVPIILCSEPPHPRGSVVSAPPTALHAFQREAVELLLSTRQSVLREDLPAKTGRLLSTRRSVLREVLFPRLLFAEKRRADNRAISKNTIPHPALYAVKVTTLGHNHVAT
jgi:hypothetical protein